MNRIQSNYQDSFNNNQNKQDSTIRFISGVTRVKGQPGQLTNKQGCHMGEDELTPPRFLKENSFICQCVDEILHPKCNFY